ESQQGFGRQKDILVAREGTACRPGATAGQCTDQGAFAAAGESTYHGAQTRAAAGHDSGTLAFAFLSSRDRAGCDGVAAPARSDTLKTDGQRCSAFETAQGFGVDNRAFRLRAFGNDRLAINDNGISDGSVERVACLAGLRAQVLIEADAQVRTGGQINHGWRGRRLRGAGRGLRRSSSRGSGSRGGLRRGGLTRILRRLRGGGSSGGVWTVRTL